MTESKRDEIINDLADALKEFMDVWGSGDSVSLSKRAQARRAKMWEKAKAALTAAGKGK